MSRPIKPIEDWLNEIEGFGLRQERLYDEVKPGDFPALIRWLEAAYLEGNKAAREDFYRDFSPSDIEKVTGIPDIARGSGDDPEYWSRRQALKDKKVDIE